jgi:predicted nucleic acid-binding protein
MTSQPSLSPATLVLDATCLSHFARADRLDVLGELLIGRGPHTTHVVREEIRTGLSVHPALADVLALDWLGVTVLDTLDQISRFVMWAQRVGAGQRHLGEASVLAVAEECHAVAIVDDRDATRVGRTYGVEVHGSVWLLASARQQGKLTEVGASNLVDALITTGMWLPCTGPEFSGYARTAGLL